MIKRKIYRTYILIFSLILAVFIFGETPTFAEEKSEEIKKITPQSGGSDEPPKQPDEKTAPTNLLKDWTIRLGAMEMYLPKYDGSKSMRFVTIPLILVDYKHIVIFSGMGISVFAPIPKTERKLIAGLTLSYDYIGVGVTNFKNPDYGIVLSPSISYIPNKNFNITFTANKTFKGSDGLELELKIRTNFNIIGNLDIGFDAFGRYLDTKRMQFKFGVSDEESRKEGYPSYYPGASFSAVGAGINIRYNFFKKVYCGLFFQSDVLLNNAAKSPTTETIFVPRTILSLSYSF